MINLILSIGLLLGNPSVESVQVNAMKSSVKWKGEKITKVHTGTLQLKDGSLDFEDGKFVGGKFRIDMSTVKEENGTTKLENHLMSPDFFDAKSYPFTTLSITKVTPQGGDRYKITADATIKGTTKQLVFIAEVKKDGKNYKAAATFTFDRSEFNVRYGSGSFFDDLGDKVIYDDIEITVNLVTGN